VGCTSESGGDILIEKDGRGKRGSKTERSIKREWLAKKKEILSLAGNWMEPREHYRK
jgi:hypothetical protein